MGKVIRAVIVYAVFLFGAFGYGNNIYKLASCDFEAPYKAEVVHAVGIIPIVGGITGYMDLGK